MENQLGRIGIVYRGVFDPVTEYDKLDFVYFNGGGYIAKRPSTGKLPDQNPDDWGDASKSASVEDRQAAELAARQAAASEQATVQAKTEAQTAQANAQLAADTAMNAKEVAVKKAAQAEALAQQAQTDAERAELAANSVDGPALMQAINEKAPMQHTHGNEDLTGLGDWAKSPEKPVYTWDEVQGKPAVFPSEAHTHGRLTHDGKLAVANGVCVTDTDGSIQAETVKAFRERAYIFKNIKSTSGAVLITTGTNYQTPTYVATTESTKECILAFEMGAYTDGRESFMVLTTRGNSNSAGDFSYRNLNYRVINNPNNYNMLGFYGATGTLYVLNIYKLGVI